MWPLRIIVFALTMSLIVAEKGYAFDNSDLRIGGYLGFGSGGAMNGGNTRVEGPLGIGFFVDYSMNSRLSLGAEHLRSFAGGSTAIGITAMTTKYYFYTSQPQIFVSPEEPIEKTMIMQKNIVPYIGGAFGFAQASFPETAVEPQVLAVAPYLGFKLGLEYPISGAWGTRCELNYGQSVGGTGVVEMTHLMFGLYTFW